MGLISAHRVHGKGTQESESIVIEGERPCGSGRFSNVYSADMTSPEKRKVALKNAWEDKPNAARPIYPEIAILSELSHPNVVSLLYHFTRKLDNKLIHCLVLEFLPSDVAKMRINGTRFDLLDAKLYSYQLFSAVAYLSSKSIVHLDIKPANLILDHQIGILKLADFGNAKRPCDMSKDDSPYQVTRYYRAPELLFGSNAFTPAIDTWSAACVVFEFVANKTLFKGKDREDQVRLIVDTFGYPSEDEIKAMKTARPRVRAKAVRGIKTVAGADVPDAVVSLLSSALVYSPDLRMKPDQILKEAFFAQLMQKPLAIRSNGNPIPDLAKMGGANDDDEEDSSSDSD